jgi:hypothetical protein
MTQYLLKIGITTLTVVLVSEIAKRSSLAAAVLASIPLVSVLALIWLYVDTRDIGQVNALSRSIVWLVLPSLVLFIVLPLLTERGHGFAFSLIMAIGATVIAYILSLAVARMLGFQY